MAAGRKTATLWALADFGIDPARLASKVLVSDLFVPTTEKSCEFIEGENEADAGRMLALRLREDGLI